MVRLLLAFVLTTGSEAWMHPAGVVYRPSLARTGEGCVVMSSQRWKDPILDESLPDPVYDDETPYLGRAPYGFSKTAERLNGRAAMVGFTVLYLQELIVGKGVLEQYGLPYDVGAQLQDGATGVPSLVGLALAVGLTAGGSFGAQVLGNAFKSK
ncbi:hypothetical protein AB1Y20_003911 [Prymnesium parvum]|uniref:PSI subunit V n=1 Tax=Prymnesium parvum TaxID=97485 RepID=A0AB34J6J3_PRYPA